MSSPHATHLDLLQHTTQIAMTAAAPQSTASVGIATVKEENEAGVTLMGLVADLFLRTRKAFTVFVPAESPRPSQHACCA